MARLTTHPYRKVRQEAAQAREVARANRCTLEQLDILNARPGKCLRERVRLMRTLDKEQLAEYMRVGVA